MDLLGDLSNMFDLNCPFSCKVCKTWRIKKIYFGLLYLGKDKLFLTILEVYKNWKCVLKSNKKVIKK